MRGRPASADRRADAGALGDPVGLDVEVPGPLAVVPRRRGPDGRGLAAGISHRRGDVNERAIIDTAECLLAEVPLADLARRAGVSRSSIYFCFASKNDVLLALLDEAAGELRVAVEAMAASVAQDPRAERERGAAPDTGPSPEQLATALVRINEHAFHLAVVGDPPALGDDAAAVLTEIWLRTIYGRDDL